MSRTPLFRMLRRSYRVASYAITHVEPLDEVLDRRESATDTVARGGRAGMTRREIVAGTTAVATVAALDACVPARPPVVSPRAEGGGPPVLIVGAGVAGLTAGYRLRQAGILIRIIEAQNRVGGRMYSLRNFFADGPVCELGGELIDTNHERIQKLAAELGIELDDLSKDDASLAHDTFYFDGAIRRERDVIGEFVPVARCVVAAIQPLGTNLDVGFRAPHADAVSLDRISVTQWLDSVGVSGWFRQRTSFGGVEGDPVDGLHFAGEHRSRYAQGFMEGGCETGERAARAIAEARGTRIGDARRLAPRRLLAAAA